MIQPIAARSRLSARDGPNTACSGTRLMSFQPTDGMVCQAIRCGSGPSSRPVPAGCGLQQLADLRKVRRADRR